MNVGKFKLLGGVAAIVTVLSTAYLLTDRRADDLGGVASTRVAAGLPDARNDSLAPVSPSEATKRAATNSGRAEEVEAKGDGGSYVAPPVIAAVGPPRKGEYMDTPELPPVPVPVTPEVPTPQIPQIATQDTGPTVIYAYQRPVADQRARERIQSQVDAILRPIEGGFVVRSYAAPPQVASSGQAGGQGGVFAAPSVMVARSGDVAYAALDRGFNSVDPQAPIFATIFDYREDGSTGPLHGARVMGQISYSREQAALTFNSLVMPTGMQYPIRAVAITEQDGRTGVAQKVDPHTLERYSGLLVAGLIQGAGQVGQQLIDNNQSYMVTGAGTVMAQSQSSTLLEAGMAALEPVGTALSSAASQVFNKPATISSPQGMGMGLVFVEALQIPIDQIRQGAAIAGVGERR